MTDRIVYSGSAIEGVIGSPKETNPYNSVTQVDKDLNTILYSSLLDNNLQPRLAEKVEVSNDKSIYRITMRPDIYFSNGDPITLDDILYSLNYVPLEKNYSVEKTSDNVLTFQLKKSDPIFLQQLTYPIIQKDTVFENNFSTKMVTSSFFKIAGINKDLDSNVTSISLNRFNNGEAKLPYFKKYNLVYFKDEVEAYNAFQKKEIDLLSGIPGSTISKITDDTNIKFEVAALPNNYAVFLNQNKNEVLQNKALRQAMSNIVDRESLTNQVLGSFGTPMKNILGEKGSPKTAEEVLRTLTSGKDSGFSFKDGVLYEGTKKASTSENRAIKIKLTTIQNTELVETAKYLQNSWKKIGIETDIDIIDRKNLSDVVKERDFEALLFGFSIKSEKDYYSFFSSKERGYPKLNISNYTSRQTDKILDVLAGDNNQARVLDLVNQLSVEIADDNPIILLYKPQFVFTHFANFQVKLPKTIKSEEERYTYIQDWYSGTEKVFNFFNQSKFVDKLDILLY